MRVLFQKKINKNRLDAVTTGGTTGMPMKFLIDNSKARAKELAFILDELKRINYSVFDKVASIRGIKVLGVKIFSHYGHAEKSVFAGECEYTENMHFSPFYGYTETINNQGFDCGFHGEIGEVIVTGFNQEYFPFIRYKTEDIVEYSNKKCKCKRNFQIATKIIATKNDFVIDGDKNIRVFTRGYRLFWGIEDYIEAYQFIQNSLGELILKIEGKKFNENIEEKIIDKWPNFFPDFVLKIERVEKIERTARGKFLYLVQNLKLD